MKGVGDKCGRARNKMNASNRKEKRSSKKRRKLFNPSTPELNPSAQRCLPRFFTGDFNF
jgi:hypothetical protein